MVRVGYQSSWAECGSPPKLEYIGPISPGPPAITTFRLVPVGATDSASTKWWVEVKTLLSSCVKSSLSLQSCWWLAL